MMPAQPIRSSRGAGDTAREETTPDATAVEASESFAEFVTSVFQSWRAHGIAFLVLRNYDTLPVSTSNDIDVLILTRHFRQAERLMVSAAERAGYVLHNRVRFATTAYYFYHPPTQRQVHLDLFSSLRWYCLPLLPADEVVAARLNRGLYDIPNPLHEALLSLLTSLVYRGQVKEKHKATIHAGLRSEPELARSLLADAVGHRLAQQCVDRAVSEEWTAVESLCRAFRRALIRRQIMRHPLNTLRAVVNDSLRLMERLVRPPGVTVVLLSQQPSVAAALGERLIVNLRHTFDPGRGVHRIGARSSAADIVQRRLALIRDGLVVIDGRASDLSTDEPRGRHHLPDEDRHRLSRLAKTADCLFLLDGVPDDVATGQGTPPIAHLSRAESCRSEVAALPNACVIDATQSPEQVTFEITRHVLHTMRRRAASRGLHKHTEPVLRPSGR